MLFVQYKSLSRDKAEITYKEDKPDYETYLPIPPPLTPLTMHISWFWVLGLVSCWRSSQYLIIKLYYWTRSICFNNTVGLRSYLLFTYILIEETPTFYSEQLERNYKPDIKLYFVLIIILINFLIQKLSLVSGLKCNELEQI